MTGRRGAPGTLWRWGRGLLVAVAVSSCLTAVPKPLSAQGLRGWIGTNVQFVELRPYGLDTIPRAGVTVGPGGEYISEGRQVSCQFDDYCTGYTTLDEAQLVAATQDLSLTAWGFGVEGLSFSTLLRGRAHRGSGLLWPRSNDDFDAMLAYGQLLLGPLKFRAGRQELRSGLGFPAFDGGSVTYSSAQTQIEGYGGRSLARGLREPGNAALRGVEDFFVDEGVYLVGASLRRRLNGAVLTARYHRETLADGSGLVAERGAVDFSTALPQVRVSGSMDYDFAFDRLGKSNLTVGMPVGGTRLLVEATARRYVPYFQLSTIWGFFEPVSYSEVELRASWAPGSALGLWASAGRRDYGEANAQSILGPPSDTGWRANAGGRFQVASWLVMDGSYRMEWGPGAFLSSGDVAFRLDTGEGATFTLSGTTFQQIEEFRIGEGRALGGGMSMDVEITDRTSLAGGLSVLRHRDGGTVMTSPWNQTRGWTSFRVAIGDDPGLANKRKSR